MLRPTWDETWMEVARVVAQRSSCSRAQVGAVVVDPGNRIVATGYNNPPAGFHRPWRDQCDGTESTGYCLRGKFGPGEGGEYSDCSTIHAETNALSFCDRRDREGGSIYVTGVPCYTCAKTIANSGLRRVVVWNDSFDRPHRDWSETREFMIECGLTVIEMNSDG